MSQVGVLFMTFGAVESLDDLPAYFTNIRGGQPPSPEQLQDLRLRYERIGGRSPLLEITRRQAQGIEASLRRQGHAVPVAVGMRFWSPTVEEGVRELVRRGARRIVAITSGPYDSQISLGSYERHLRSAVERVDASLSWHLVRHWYDAERLMDAWTSRYHEALEGSGWASDDCHVLLSAHSLPERVLVWNDPYPRQFSEHAQRVARHLRLTRWGMCYQSAGLTQEPWLGPDVLHALDYLKAMGTRRVLSLPIGFCADHLEILNDLDHEAAERARTLGLEWRRARSLNDSPFFVQALTQTIERCLPLQATAP